MEETQEKKEKFIKSSEAKCKSCGGNLRFDPSSQNLKCDNCSTIYDITKAKTYPKHSTNEKPNNNAGYKDWVENNKVFKCSNCGSTVIFNSLEISKCCPYCGNAVVSETDELPGSRPDSIIPFRFDANTAGERFVQNVRKKFYVNGKFKKKLPENQIKGTYVPAFVFDANSNSTYSGVLSKNVSVQTSNGTKTVIKSINISGSIKVQHTDVVIEASSKVTQNDMSGILPFEYNSAYNYNNDFIRGYTVEHYQDAMETCEQIAKQQYNAEIKQAILRKYPDYTIVQSLNFNPVISDEKFHYQLVPIYKFEYKFKKKDYSTYMNGQTGKVDNNLPKSIPKIIATVILGLLIILLPILITLLSD